MFSSNFNLTQKIYHVDKIFVTSTFLNTFKLALQYLFNVLLLFNTVFYFKLNFKLKIDPKMSFFKNLEKIWKTWKNLEKMCGNPVLFFD